MKMPVLFDGVLHQRPEPLCLIEELADESPFIACAEQSGCSQSSQSVPSSLCHWFGSDIKVKLLADSVLVCCVHMLRAFRNVLLFNSNLHIWPLLRADASMGC